MRHGVMCIVLGLALMSSIQARLVPKNFCDDPPVQRLTATFTNENMETDAFGQCRGISMRPVNRTANQQIGYYLWAVADEACDGIVYGLVSEQGGVRELGSPARFGTRGSGNGQFLQPTGVAVDTTLFTAGYSYVYVADSRNGRIVRCTFDWSTSTLSFGGGVGFGVEEPVDVDCLTAPDGQTALLAVLDAGTSTVSVLRVGSGLTPELLATYGSEGSGEGQFLKPTGLCIRQRSAGSYYIYVADQHNARVVALVLSEDEQSHEWAITWLNQYQDAYGYPGFVDVATSDPYGYVYVTATFANAIYVFRPELAGLAYVRSGGVDGPLSLACLGDEIAMTETWSAQSGIQYFRVVPDIEILCNHSLLDAATDSLLFSVQIEELNGYADISIIEGNTVQRHLVADLAMNGGTRYDFCWDGRCDDGALPLPGYYSIRVAVSCRPDESDPDFGFWGRYPCLWCPD